MTNKLLTSLIIMLVVGVLIWYLIRQQAQKLTSASQPDTTPTPDSAYYSLLGSAFSYSTPTPTATPTPTSTATPTPSPSNTLSMSLSYNPTTGLLTITPSGANGSISFYIEHVGWIDNTNTISIPQSLQNQSLKVLGITETGQSVEETVMTASATPTLSATATPAPSVSATPSATATPVPSASVTPTPSATATPAPSVSATPSATATPVPTPIASIDELLVQTISNYSTTSKVINVGASIVGTYTRAELTFGNSTVNYGPSYITLTIPHGTWTFTLNVYNGTMLVATRSVTITLSSTTPLNLIFAATPLPTPTPSATPTPAPTPTPSATATPAPTPPPVINSFALGSINGNLVTFHYGYAGMINTVTITYFDTNHNWAGSSSGSIASGSTTVAYFPSYKFVKLTLAGPGGSVTSDFLALPTPTVTPTATPTPSATATPVPSATATPAPSASATPAATILQLKARVVIISPIEKTIQITPTISGLYEAAELVCSNGLTSNTLSYTTIPATINVACTDGSWAFTVNLYSHQGVKIAARTVTINLSVNTSINETVIV